MDYLLSKSYRKFDRITFHVSRSHRCICVIAPFKWYIFKTNLLKQLPWKRRTCFHLRSCSLRIERFNIIANSEFLLMQFDSIYIFGLYFVQSFRFSKYYTEKLFSKTRSNFFFIELNKTFSNIDAGSEAEISDDKILYEPNWKMAALM